MGSASVLRHQRLRHPGSDDRVPDAPPVRFRRSWARVLSRFPAWFAVTDEALDARFGRPRRKLVAGISFGGFLAITAAQNPNIDAWAGLSPVTDISVLPEFRWQDNASCSPLRDPPKTRGIVAYSTDDARVDARLIARFARNAHVPALVTSGIGHTTSAAQARAVAAFLGSNATKAQRH